MVVLSVSAEGGIRKTESASEGVVTSSSNFVSDSLFWKEVFKFIHYVSAGV